MTERIKRLVNLQFEMEVYNTDCDKLEATNWTVTNKKGKQEDWWSFYTISLENSIKWDEIVKKEARSEEEYIRILLTNSLATRWS